MGRLVKQPTVGANNQGVVVPPGTTAQRPANPTDGFIRFNTDLGYFETYSDGFWRSLASRGALQIIKDVFTADGSTTIFTLSEVPNSETGAPVYLGNIHQSPGIAYTITGGDLTFFVAPPEGELIEVFHGFDTTNSI